MNKTYLITLTPTGKFFFGGDMTFSVNEKETDFTSYIIRSNKFPQQTSLLGMLRFLLLRNNKDAFDQASQSIKDRALAAELIGPKSFTISNEEAEYGRLKSISPCFIQVGQGETAMQLLRAAKDAGWEVDFTESANAVINGKGVCVPNMNYDAKKYYEPMYICSSCGQSTRESDIFIEDIYNGINRNIDTGKTENNALFKQISYRMKEGYCFAFYAVVEMDDLADYSGQVVQVGGDNSQFIIGIQPRDIPASSDKLGTRVELLSPAYLSKEDLGNVRFAVTDTIPFRCMNTTTKEVQSYNKQNLMYGYSQKLSLYDTGSVFYFSSECEAAAFIEKLKSYTNFYQIGYNHYQITDY